MQKDKVLSFIGLAKKAGKITAGAPQCEKAVKAKTELIIIAKDASDNTKKTIIDSCNYYKVKFIEYSTMEIIGNIIGAKSERAVIAVNDKGFADAILKNVRDL